ncbi:nuclear transport factor 2 family protein [Actinoplanes sp. M2I2]|uniref:nuclear transport factor 2 family protein n=1 Tax=Actinoplanes sp. M2I2 TaxID=1734444 RepID=UPI002020AF67|nr:nuclear transport factor 2 family protein [Actinoplanes sp. M2I2]
MTEANKRIVQRALSGLVETGDTDTLGSFLSEDFVHHRPGPAGRTKAAWLADVRAAQGPLAAMRVEVRHLVADDQYVMVHSARRLGDAGPQVAVVDICRLEGGLIAEIWETIEPVSQAPANLRWWEV